MGEFRNNQDVTRQVYDPATGQIFSAAETAAPYEEEGLTKEEEQPAEAEKTKVEEQKSGGATIVDFDYEQYAEVERNSTHTDAVAALTLGILSIVCNLFGGVIAVILGIFGIVFSVKGRRDEEKRSMATAGLICSVIGIIIGVLRILAAIALAAFFIFESPFSF